jgi:hypothetical protein
MNTKIRRRGLSLSLILLMALIPLVLTAAAAVGYDLSWWSVDGGGGTSTGGGYTLLGAIGQPDAGVMQGGGFSLAGGLLGGGASSPIPSLHNFLPLVAR